MLAKPGQIVDHQSAVLGVSLDREVSLGVDRDHSNICKFESRNDDYEQVEDEISQLVEYAIKAARVSGQSIPVSPEPSTTPLSPDSNVTPLDESGPSVTAGDEMQQGLGIQAPEYRLDALSLTDSIDQRTPSIAPSESTETTENGDRRQSSSTDITSASSIPGSTVRQGKYTTQSPRLLSSIKMNVGDTGGLALRDAAAKGQKDVVMAMLEKGALIDNSGVWDGYTALADAAVHGQDGVVELLLNEGANPAFRCLHSTSKFGSKENTPLSLAAGKGHLGCMRLLLAKHTYTKQELNEAYRAAKSKNRNDAIQLIKESGGGLY